MTRRFEVVEELSRHGRAVVFRAKDNNSGSLVSLRRYAGTPEELQSLGAVLAELASLRHPNLEHFREVGEDDDGLFAIVDESWGEPLTDTLKRGPLTVAEFEQVAQQMLAALCALHEAGYPHLALRPELVRIVADRMGEITVRITGYGEGFARPGDAQHADIAAYRCCAPEHWRDEAVGRRTDVYALGCILYEALAGRPAFVGDTAANLRSAHLENDVAPLESAAPHAPRWITAWIMHLLQPSADLRVKNAMQARDLYEQREAGLAITAASLQSGERILPPPMPAYSQPGYAYPPAAAVAAGPGLPGTAEVPSARATSTAVPIMVQGTPAYRRPAVPPRPAATPTPSMARRPMEELRVLLSMAVAAVCVVAIVVYLLANRQPAENAEGLAAAVSTLPITAGLMLQLDADRPETVFRDPTTGRIRRWKNASGTQPHMEQEDRESMPALLAKGLGERSTIDFGPAKTGQWMLFADEEGAPMNLTGIRTVFWVLKGSNSLLGDDNTTHFQRGEPEGSPTAKILRSAEAATMKVRLNGKDVNAATSSLPNHYAIVSAVTAQSLEASQLCKDRDQPGRRGGQQIAEVLIYSRPLDAAEVSRIEAYLRRKWFGQ